MKDNRSSMNLNANQAIRNLEMKLFKDWKKKSQSIKRSFQKEIFLQLNCIHWKLNINLISNIMKSNFILALSI